MAGFHVSCLKPNEVSANLRSGTFALKWPEETNKPVIPIAVNLSVDAKGFYLICLNKVTKESECFDIALIHDTRTGSDASLPRGAIECEQMNIGVMDVPLSSKWLTIYYGNTFIPDRELRVIHFSFHSPIVAREWTEHLFQYGHNPLLRNLSSLECLEKCHSRIINGLIDDRFDKKAIPVRNLIQFLCKNTRDVNKETKILKTLDLLELPCRMETVIDPDQFTFNKFVRFYMQLMERHEIDKLFDATSEIDDDESILAIIPGGKHRRYLSWEKVRDFIVKQNDARGDAFGMDYYDQKAKDLVKKYTQHDEHFIQKGMYDESFLRYLLSFDNLIVDPAKFDLFMDMDKPLAHYFISSSHNTYLTGSQLTGRASTEMYRQVLLTGCRCIELDVVDSEKKNDEPEIKHRNTPVRSVPFLQVIIAIRECAFKVSPYPLILSLENHCSARAQAKMAQYLVDIFGDSLITQPLKTHPIEDNCPLPSPNDLKYKILIKNKKLHESTNSRTTNLSGQTSVQKTDSITTSISDQNTGICIAPTSPVRSYSSNRPTDFVYRGQTIFNEKRNDFQSADFDSQLMNDNNRHGVPTEEDDNTSSDDDVLTSTSNGIEANTLSMNTNSTEMIMSDPTTTMIHNLSYPTNSDALAESKATKAMSDLVHYIVPVRFVTFARAEERNRSYEISSFAEDKAQNLIRDYAKEFVAYNQRQLSRIYPRGTRIDSSNYNPYLFWPVGCQMVALNYQTLDTPMQVNLGLFSFNGSCGYLEKPSSLCQSTGSFDPKGRANVENVVGYQIDIKIISGQFLCQDREPTYVDIEMYGLYADSTKRHEYRLRAKRWNGFQAVYDDTDVETGEFSVRFSRVILPEMAALRFAVCEEDGTFIGQSFIPVAHLRPGYRHVVLRNQISTPVQSLSLFVYIRKDVHVDAENKELIEQLVSPTSVSIVTKEQQPKPIKFKPLSEQRSQSAGDLNITSKSSDNEIKLYTDITDGSVNDSLRPHFPSTIEINGATARFQTKNKKRNQSTPIVDANWYLSRLIDSSQLRDDERLCQELFLHDVEETKLFKRKRETIQAKIRRASVEYDKKIQNEEERFQKCLYRQQNQMTTSLQKPVNQWTSSELDVANSPYTDGRTSSLIHQKFISDEMKQAESRLLDLYSSKFHSQNEVEYKLSKEYYNDLEKYINDYYTKQLNQIHNILKHEQLKVKEDVRVQMKTETKKKMMTETDRERIATLKDKIRQINIEAGALAIRKLQEMHEKLEKKVQLNLQNTLHRLHEKKDLETKNRFATYSNQLNEIKFRLQRDICNTEYLVLNDDKTSPKLFRPTITSSASLSAISDHHQIPMTSSTFTILTSPSNVMTSNQSNRRQTIDNTNIRTNRPNHEELMCYINQTTESTRL
ncbi:unnamed protein product [Rotaria sp. Silwood1]|nr:unnamed protein product [Rotaria sp. Silwood1]CAF1323169.1 unnamed protein product [Rotaria sp. Silwood1]CAF3492730.1 unnamed protein product [Rotaria sp. Silwood1]CAF3548303.1 unnamed protein product [Rotaria sp. Silwood1]CAF4598169.1 unnamed protein product [Rotaria sp. Silwood1]